ncbi:subtilisin family serine protease [Agromyces hippuratus]|uniref:Subtilisin family serine protease n=1 Tax=Agromyces hippuratus TaxID=286438 RepID=A0A852X7R0_9MICO|nr:S8 family serine peptidase [Agromyces hippuratus]NYG21955.1 subtilisin family serine protease [Agromyces hippuratus]
MRPIWRSTITAATVAVMVATTASPSNAVESNEAGEQPPIVGSTAWLGQQAAPPVTVTLVNGDRVLVTNGTTVTVLPREDGSQPIVETRRVGDDVYVYPADVIDALAAGKVDEELFNVTGLVRQGYDDAHSASMPLIAQYADPAAPVVTPRGAEAGIVLESIGSAALSADKADAAAFWADLTNPRSRSAGSIEKLWLDRKVEAALDQSTAQVNAPDAWAAGLDGAGATVAILDTGADAEHPDLQGRIIAGEDFTDSGSWNDGNGHGTHVASTVGGSGAASDGAKRGVAPQADLLVGKVLSDFGSGSTSGIIAGMEWAVAQGADVVSMSLGSTGPVDGCADPMAMAAGSLSESSDSLFVIAAGNVGPGNNTVSSPGCAPAVLTVGAVDRDDSTAVFSSRGPVAGTHVLKPEITAPGVGISAAATGGRGEYAYRSMSGTSMATPHVAGAAAIVKQRHPEWDGEQIKAALVSSAETDIPGDVRETGGGRLDVSAAIDETVTGAPALQAGSFDWPHTTDEAVAIDVPYTNVSDAPVTLRLEIEGLTGNDGSAVKGKLAKLEQDSVTIAAGETATVPLRVDPSAKLSAAQYGDVTGRIVATGDATVSTPFSLYVQPETVQVTVKVVDRNGDPAAGASSLDIVNTDTSSGSRWYNGGAEEQVVDVRPGRFFVSSFIATPDADGTTKLVDSVSYVARPELSITDDTTVVLDARDADRITVKTDRRSETRAMSLSFARSWDDMWGHSGTLTAGATVTSVYADVQGTAHDGDFEFGHYWRKAAPLVEDLSVVGGDALHPIPAGYSSMNLTGTGRLPVVDAGSGTDAELAAADVAGKIALVRIADGTGSVYAEVVAAGKAGAKAVVAFHEATGRWQPLTGSSGGQVPAYSIPSDEAAALRERLAAGPVELQWSFTSSSPFVYNLGFSQDTPFTDAKEFVVRDKKLGRTEATFRSMGTAVDRLDLVTAVDASGNGVGVGQFQPVQAPSKRTELYTAGELRWQSAVLGYFPFGEVMLDQVRQYEPGSVRSDTWYDGVIAPSAAESYTGEVQLAAERQGNLMGFASGMWADSSGHWAGPGSFGDIGNLVLRRNGEEIGRSAYISDVFEVPADDAEYELQLFTEKIGRQTNTWQRSSAVTTVWKFRSHLDESTYSQGLPVMFPRVDLPEDGMKTLAANADQRLQLNVAGHAGYTPGTITSAGLAYSYDGETWVDATTLQEDGEWVAIVDHSGASGQPVSLRVTLTDSNDNSVTQTVVRAYDVR